MRNIFSKKIGLLSVLVLIFLSSVSIANAAGLGLIPCDGGQADPCDFYDFVKLGQNLINYLILISIPLTAITISYAGFLIVTSAGSEEKVKQGKGIMTKVIVGFIFILSAWLIVYTVTTALLKPDTADDYNLLKS